MRAVWRDGPGAESGALPKAIRETTDAPGPSPWRSGRIAARRTQERKRMNAHKLFLSFLVALPALAAAANPASRDLTAATRAKPDLEHGAELFVQCVSCHLGNGAGQLNGNTPRIAGQHYSVLLKQLVDFRHGKRWDFRMEEHANQHFLETPQDLADVAAYVSQMDGGDQ